MNLDRCEVTTITGDRNMAVGDEPKASNRMIEKQLPRVRLRPTTDVDEAFALF
jgi:hypothetical protein